MTERRLILHRSLPGSPLSAGISSSSGPRESRALFHVSAIRHRLVDEYRLTIHPVSSTANADGCVSQVLLPT